MFPCSRVSQWGPSSGYIIERRLAAPHRHSAGRETVLCVSGGRQAVIQRRVAATHRRTMVQ